MSLHHHDVVVSPFEIAALHNLIAAAPAGADKDVAYRWLAYARSGLYEQWQKLPDGHHLKDAYRDDVWMWDDQDLAAIPKDRLVRPEDVRAMAQDLDVDDVEGLI